MEKQVNPGRGIRKTKAEMFRRAAALLLTALALTFLISCGGGKGTSREANTVADPGGLEKEERPEGQVEPGEEVETGNGDTVPPGEDEGENKDGEKGSPEFVFPQKGVRPVAVMIDNEGTKCLPQGGLDMAQIIYEIVVEGDLTRLMPVYWGVEPPMIGPVRSSRHYFLDYAMEHDAIYVHFGWSPMAENDIKQLGINNINGVGWGGEVFFDITKDTRNWQDSYTSWDRLAAFIKKARYRTSSDKEHVFSYNREEVPLKGGKEALKIDIRYSSAMNVSYTYDPERGLYMRYRMGKPHIERTTGEQLSAKNIIILAIGNSRIKGDKEGRQELYNIGEGSGWYITGGKAIKIKWSKTSRASPTSYTDEEGKPIILNPGQTWIQIVPKYAKIVI